MEQKMELMERACDRATAQHRKGCPSLDNWIAWADALLGIAECHQSLYCKRLFIDDAIQKLDMAISKDITNPRSNWSMGNAHLARGSVSADLDSAQQNFRMASLYFSKAVSLEPNNEKYVESLKKVKEVQDEHKDFNRRSHFYRFLLAICFTLGSSYFIFASDKPQ